MLRCARNDAERNNITFNGLDVVRQCVSKFFKTAESGVDKVVSNCDKNPSSHWRYMNFLRQRKTALDTPLYEFSLGRSLLPQCALDATGFLSDVYKRSTRAKKFLADDVQGGKSMIEMLGVLAIIAVLSVVGLDGFSKALRMYRSAVQKETLEHLLANMVKIRNNLNHEVKTFENISYLFAAMGELPNGITFRDSRLYDKSGNSFTVYFGKNTWKTPTGTASSFEYHVRINWEQKDNSTSPTAYDSCINTLEVAKANSNEIKTVTQFIGNSEAFLSYDQSNISWKNMTVTQMNEVCKSCTAEKACSLVLYINP